MIQMSFAITVGATKERSVRIQSCQTTSFLWEGENVLSTPSMISEMEETCRLLLKEKFLAAEEWDSVGTYVNVRHLAATPVGSNVDFKAKIISVNSKKVLFEVVAQDSLETVGDGNHERHIIHVPTFRERFINKQKKLAKERREKL